MNANNNRNGALKGLFLGGFFKLILPLKISFVVGSYAAFFSLISCGLPLIGAFAGISGTVAFFVLSMAIRSIISPISLCKLLAFYVPGMMAAFSWIEQYAIIRLLVPIVCMILFLVHPVGAGAWVYTLYWLIPIAIYLIPYSGIFARSLASTFVAHAVGSVIWLYASPMTAETWIALMPVVAFERLLFASGMVILYQVIQYVQNLLPEYTTQIQYFLGKRINDIE